MAHKFRGLLLGLALALVSTGASAQSGCGGQGAAGTICGNNKATTNLPTLTSFTSLLDRAFSSQQGNILTRGAGGWTASPNPTLGLNGTVGGAITLNGSVSGSVTVRVPAAAGGAIFQLPNTNGTSGYVLTTDGAGNTSWQSNTTGGTVTSVGLSMPGIFSVTGSPVTTFGTLTATLATQSANQVWAGPDTGAAAAPTFRSLVGADLPNPSPTSLGGVQSFAAVSSQWIRQISTLGVVSASQPAFTDISGTMSPTQCPNPTASTIGCVQSFAAQASKWINAISTSGVPSATQPNFTDIAGAVSPSQLPSIGNNTVLGNISGGTAVPTGITASNVLDIIGSTRGQVLYRGASGWSALSPGTAGYVLQTGGPGADPSWIAVAGTGTVTSVAAGTGLSASPSPITTTGTMSLANIADQRILANVSGGSAAPIANTMTAILDATLGSTQGNILYRGASNWTVLAPGTNGQVLTQGASTPSWASSGTVSNVTITNGAGLTESGTCNISTTGTCTISSYFDPGSITNCTLVPSVAGNNLTVALKTQAGADPSASSPCTISFRSATAATGDYTAVNATAATSVTINSGSTLGASLSGFPFRVWVTAWNNAGTIALGLSVQTNYNSNSTYVLPINEDTPQSSTACSACGTATSVGTFYTTSALSSKALRIIGYMTWESGLASAGVWNAAPTRTQMMGPGINRPGNLVSRSQTYTGTATTSSSAVTYVPTNLTKTISKQSAANPVNLRASGGAIANAGGAVIDIVIYRGAGACTSVLSNQSNMGTLSLNYVFPHFLEWFDGTGTSSSQSYTVCMIAAAGVSSSFPYSGGVLVLEEIMG